MERLKNKLLCCKPNKQQNVEEKKEVGREKWGSEVDFWLSVLGWNVGLSNLWRFPYLCMRNGGGAFLIPYFIFLILCALPLMFLEFSIAQYSSQGLLGVWKMCPLFKDYDTVDGGEHPGIAEPAVTADVVGHVFDSQAILRRVGYSTNALMAVCAVYYVVIITWIIYYMVSSFATEVPWASCDNQWNTPYCISTSKSHENVQSNVTIVLGNISGLTTQQTRVLEYFSNSSNRSLFVNGTNNMTVPVRTSVDEFWRFNVLEISDGIENLGHVRWQLLLCFGLAWVVTFLCIIKGIRSAGKVVYVTATLPYVLLVVLLVRGVMLDGALEGIKYYVTPDFQQLKNPKVWAEACVQIFYSMGMCWGALLTMASYNDFHYNCYRNSLILTTCGALTSFFAGFVIFSVIGFLARELNVPVSEAVKGGPALAFIAYPEALSKLPGAPVWSVLFFVMLFTVGLDGQFPMVESIATSITDEFPGLTKKKTLVSAIVCLIGFFLGLPMITQGGVYVLQLLDWYLSVFTIMVIGLCECLVVAWIYGANRMYDNIEEMLGFRPNRWWQICWRFITPATVAFILIYNTVMLSPVVYSDYTYPVWGHVIGYCVAILPMMSVPGYMIYKVACDDGPVFQRIKKLLRPSDDFGPPRKANLDTSDKLLEEYKMPTISADEQLQGKHKEVSPETRSCLV